MAYVPNRGDIVQIDCSPHAGHEQGGRRPAIVLTPSSYNGLTGQAVVVPVTGKSKGFRFEVPLPEAIRTRGVALSDHVRSFDWRTRDAVFEETAPQEVLDEVTARVAALLGLP